MPLVYRIDVQQRCIFVKLCHNLGDWDLGVGVQALMEDPQFNSQFSRLVDATEVKTATTQPAFLEAIAQDFRTRTAAKVALLAPSEPAYELLRQYQENLQYPSCRLFRDKATALQWLGVSAVDVVAAG